MPSSQASKDKTANPKSLKNPTLLSQHTQSTQPHSRTKPNSMKELGLEHLEYFLQYRVEQGFGVYYIVNNRDLGYPQIM